MENYDGMLKDMAAGELIELLLVGRQKHDDPFFWFEQVERVLLELKTRLKPDQLLDVKAVLKIIRQENYR